jgi:hypothetical protein
MMTRILPSLLLVALLAACGSVEAATVDPASLTVTIVERGGCEMMGPNCRVYVVAGDGTFQVERAGLEDQGAVASGELDESIAEFLREAVAGTDLAGLAETLPPGECRGCADGIDYLVTVDVDGTVTTFDSVEVLFDPTEPLFTAIGDVIAAASAVEVPILSR